MDFEQWRTEFIEAYEYYHQKSYESTPRKEAALKSKHSQRATPAEALDDFIKAGMKGKQQEYGQKLVNRSEDKQRNSARQHMVDRMRNEDKDIARIKRLAGIELKENQDSTTLVADAMARYIMGDSDAAIGQLQRLAKGGLGFGELSDDAQMYNAVYQEVFQGFKDAIDGAVNYSSVMNTPTQSMDIGSTPMSNSLDVDDVGNYPNERARVR